MDHAMSNLMTHIEFAADIFIEEWESGKYTKISECPTYEEVKVYCDAYNILANYYFGKERTNVNPKQFVGM